MVNKYNVEQGSEAWFDLRVGRITASKFSDLMAGESTKTYKDLIYNTAGEIIAGTKEESYSNAIMERGVELEPEARLLYEEVCSVMVDQVGFVTHDEIHPEYIGVSPDGMIDGGGLIEIKCPIMKTHIGYLDADKLPTIYKWQVQGQLLVTGEPFCDFMSYYPGIRPLIVRVEPDKEMHEQLLERIEITVKQIKEIVNRFS